MKKKCVLYIVNIVSILAIASAVIVLLSVVLTKPNDVPNICGYSVFRVLTGSMEPTIPKDSFIIVDRVDASEIKEGDIISYFSQDPSLGGTVNTHRVISVEQTEDSIVFETKGDANYTADNYPATSEVLIGKVVFVSHTLGKIVRLLSNPLIFFPLILLPMFGILILNLIHTIKMTRKIAKEEEEAAVKEIMEMMKNSKENKDT